MGNSRGVRIPKALIELCDLGEEVEVEVSEGQLIFRKAGGNRLGWAEAFERRQAAPTSTPAEPRSPTAAGPARFQPYHPTPHHHS
jgi:antitoxin component of MazEF toxin-antitoxin module